VSLITTNRAGNGAAAIGARAKEAAAHAIPVGKRAGTTAVLGVRQGVQGAREWAAPHIEEARDWAAPRLEDAVLGAREWAAPRLEDAAETVTTTVAPAVSSALLATASRVRPAKTKKTGLGRLLDWRLLLGVGAAAAAAGAGAAIAMRRRYASATEEAKNASEVPGDERDTPDSDSVGDAAVRSEVNGRVTSPGM
jgi:hypothetical protein